MNLKAAVTVGRPPDEVRRLWETSAYRPTYFADHEAAVSFAPAPGNRGTEIHVDLASSGPGGTLGEVVQKLFGGASLANVKDDLRRFKQHAETGEMARSDGTPEGERAQRKFSQRPAQPLGEPELQKVGAS